MVTRPLQLAIVDVDGDDLSRSSQGGAEDGAVADSAAADDGNGVAAGHSGRIERGAQARHHAAAEQPRDFGLDLRAHLRALPGGDERLVGEGADAESRRQWRAVGQRHLLGRVVRGKAVPRAAAQAGAALAAHRAPVEDHEVARLQASHLGADRLDETRRLVPEQVREVLTDSALAIVEVGVADTASLYGDQRLARTRVRYHHRRDTDRGALSSGDDAVHFVWHPLLLRGTGRACCSRGPRGSVAMIARAAWARGAVRSAAARASSAATPA